MKKLFKILIMCLATSLLFACVKDEDIDINIDKEEIEIQKPIKNGDIEEIIDITKKDNNFKDKIIYEDNEYGFRLELPKTWEDSYIIEKKLWIDDINESVEFNYSKDEISTNVFTIIIMNESIQHEDWEDLFLMYLLEKDGRTFSYLNVMEPTEELLMEENKEELETVTTMVEEVPGIIESFTLIN